MSNAAVIELKFEVGVPSGKLKKPPKSCIPSRAIMKMNRKSRNSSEQNVFFPVTSVLRTHMYFLFVLLFTVYKLRTSEFDFMV